MAVENKEGKESSNQAGLMIAVSIVSFIIGMGIGYVLSSGTGNLPGTSSPGSTPTPYQGPIPLGAPTPTNPASSMPTPTPSK